jgi:superfamily I DNA/RNA helicase
VANFRASKYQKAIWKWMEGWAKVPAHLFEEFLKQQRRHLRVEAVAGSGKTTTIVEAAKFIPMQERGIFLAFNKHIAEELGRRLPMHVRASTTHSLAYRAYLASEGAYRGKPDGLKTSKILREMQTSFIERQIFPQVRKMVSQAKSLGIVPVGMKGVVGLTPDTAETWEGIFERFDIDFEDDEQRDAAIGMARYVLRHGIDRAHNGSNSVGIDFDDMLYLPIVMRLQFPKFKWVIIDEAQDINLVQREMVKRIVEPGTGHVIAVGDSCQPTGTMVDVVVRNGERWHEAVIEKRPIEELQVGDVVVSLSRPDAQWRRSKHVVGITKRWYSGILIRAFGADRYSTAYTPNHHCIASFGALRTKYCVYLMRKGNKFRIGKARMDYGSVGSGLICRMTAEKADAAWILSLHDTDREALLQETVLAANHGIPELVFTAEEVWQKIEINQAKAVRLLAEFGRREEYPLLTHRVITRDRMTGGSMKRPMKVHACNLMTGCLMLPYVHGSQPLSARKEPRRVVRRSDWIEVEIQNEAYNGWVFSMTIEGDHTYVGDGLATHNCQAIYGFRGADSQSMENIRKDMNADTLPLSICYRCAKEIVREAKRIVPQIEFADSADEGSVEHGLLPGTKLAQYFTPDISVLCPFNAPLISFAFQLIKQKIAVRVLGKAIGEGVAKQLQKLGAFNVGQAREMVKDWYEEQRRRIDEEDDDKLSALQDKYEVLMVFLDDEPDNQTIDIVVGKVEALFAPAPGEGKPGETLPPGILTLSTIHKAKGLEWDHVVLIDSDRLLNTMRRRKDKLVQMQPWEIEQRMNLLYVAITRARQKLVYVTSAELKQLQ